MLGSMLHSFASLLLLKPPSSDRRNLIFLAISRCVWTSINFSRPGHFFSFLCFLSFRHLCTVARDTTAFLQISLTLTELPSFKNLTKVWVSVLVFFRNTILWELHLTTCHCCVMAHVQLKVSIRTSRISCKTHKGSQEGLALNSPFIGQQIRPQKVILKWKMMFCAEFFKPSLSDNPVQKELRHCLFQSFFQSRTSLSYFSLPLAQQVIRSDSHLSVQSSR